MDGQKSQEMGKGKRRGKMCYDNSRYCTIIWQANWMVEKTLSESVQLYQNSLTDKLLRFDNEMSTEILARFDAVLLIVKDIWSPGINLLEGYQWLWQMDPLPSSTPAHCVWGPQWFQQYTSLPCFWTSAGLHSWRIYHGCKPCDIERSEDPNEIDGNVGRPKWAFQDVLLWCIQWSALLSCNAQAEWVWTGWQAFSFWWSRHRRRLKGVMIFREGKWKVFKVLGGKFTSLEFHWATSRRDGHGSKDIGIHNGKETGCVNHRTTWEHKVRDC